MKKCLWVYLIIFLILPSLFIYTIPVTNAQPEDDVLLEESLKNIEELLIKIDEDIETLKEEVDNIHSTYINRELFEIKTDSIEESIDDLQNTQNTILSIVTTAKNLNLTIQFTLIGLLFTVAYGTFIKPRRS